MAMRSFIPAFFVPRPRLLIPCSLALSSIFFAAAPARSQDVAEAARQEKARKEELKKKTQHVYSNEDLQRARILTPEDQSRVEAARENSPNAPSANPALRIDAQSVFPNLPLGDVARMYRAQKAARAAEQAAADALKKNLETGLPMNLPGASLAAPKPLGPLNAAALVQLNSRPRLSAPKAPIVILWTSPLGPAPNLPDASRVPPAPRRVSPFQPRPFIGMQRTPLLSPSAPVLAPKNVPPPPSAALLVPKSPAAPGVSVNPSIAPKSAVAPKTTVVVPKAAAPSVTVPVSAVNAGSIVVSSGDSLWKIAKLHLGSGTKWQQLLTSNPALVDPNRLVPGRQLNLPVAAEHATSTVKIAVRAGDSFWKLARTHLGRGSAWTCIAEANPAVDSPTRLQIGQELMIPGTCHR